MSPEEKLRLTHIAEAAALIANYINGISKEAFLSDTLRQDAVIRRIEIIGEAVRHLSHELLARIPQRQHLQTPKDNAVVVVIPKLKNRLRRSSMEEMVPAPRYSNWKVWGAALATRKHAWAEACRSTPHGVPVKPAPTSAG